MSKTKICFFLQKLKLTYNSTAAEWWENPPINPLLKVHVFNYTNVDEFFEGKAPKLEVVDLGPYVFLETAGKTNVSFNNDGTITYKVTLVFFLNLIFSLICYFFSGKEILPIFGKSIQWNAV